MGAEEARQDPNHVTGTFLVNNYYASILFDTGADKSFVPTEFSPQLNIVPMALDYHYTIELANGKLVETDQVLPDCDLTLANHTFKINLLLVSLGSFNIVVGMEWLSKHQAEIVCHEKINPHPTP